MVCQTLRTKSNHICEDPFIMTYVEELRRRMREQVLLALVQPYRVMTIKFAAKVKHTHTHIHTETRGDEEGAS